MAEVTEDLYDLLGVKRSASPAELRRAFQRLARRHHPALNPGDPAAAERFARLSHAFEVLSDPARRAEYDRGEAPPSPPPAPEVGFEGFDFTAEVRRTRVDLSDIFGGGGEASVQARAPQPGEDLQTSARVSFEEAFRGTRRHVHVVRQDVCPVCRGGGDVAFGPVPCPSCSGSGQLRTRRGHMVFTRRCPACGASGSLRRRPCGRCGGEGRVMQSEWLDLAIPPGVDGGSQVRLPGLGNAGRAGAPTGDFVLTVEVERHPFYRREGADLLCTVPVTMAEAALGAPLEVPTPDGPVTIEIPAGTQAGHRFRLRKRGMPRLGEKARGDLWVEVEVRVPDALDEESRELLRELARRHPEDPRKGLAAQGRLAGRS